MTEKKERVDLKRALELGMEITGWPLEVVFKRLINDSLTGIIPDFQDKDGTPIVPGTEKWEEIKKIMADAGLLES